jgi:hypothetical protein
MIVARQDAGENELDIGHISAEEIALEEGQIRDVDLRHAPRLADALCPGFGLDDHEGRLPRRR